MHSTLKAHVCSRRLFFALLMMISTEIVSCYLTAIPKRVTVVNLSENAAVLPCGTNLSAGAVSWSFSRTGHPPFALLFDGVRRKNSSKYLIRSSSGVGRYDFIVQSVDLSDAGRYVCRDDYGFSTDFAATTELVVTTNQSVSCDFNLTAQTALRENDSLTCRCSVMYTGNPTPSITWTEATGGRPIGSTLEAQTVERKILKGSNNETLYESIITFFATSENISSHNCTIRFGGDCASETDLVGSIQMAFPEIPVWFSVRNISIAIPGHPHLYVGDVLRCTADGHPEVQYEWKDFQNGNRSKGDAYELDEEGQHLVYECTDKNVIDNVVHSVSTNVTVSVHRAPHRIESNFTEVVLICLIVTTIVAATCVILLSRYWRRRYFRHLKVTSSQPNEAYRLVPAGVSPSSSPVAESGYDSPVEDDDQKSDDYDELNDDEITACGVGLDDESHEDEEASHSAHQVSVLATDEVQQYDYEKLNRQQPTQDATAAVDARARTL